MRFWLFVILAAGVSGCGRDAPSGGAIPAYRPPAFRADIDALIADNRYADAVTYLNSADPVQQAKHDGRGYLAVGEDMIILPEVDPAVLYDPDRDWTFPGTQDAIEDAVWQSAATNFAAKYNRARRGK